MPRHRAGRRRYGAPGRPARHRGAPAVPGPGAVGGAAWAPAWGTRTRHSVGSGTGAPCRRRCRRGPASRVGECQRFDGAAARKRLRPGPRRTGGWGPRNPAQAGSGRCPHCTARNRATVLWGRDGGVLSWRAPQGYRLRDSPPCAPARARRAQGWRRQAPPGRAWPCARTDGGRGWSGDLAGNKTGQRLLVSSLHWDGARQARRAAARPLIPVAIQLRGVTRWGSWRGEAVRRPRGRLPVRGPAVGRTHAPARSGRSRRVARTRVGRPGPAVLATARGVGL